MGLNHLFFQELVVVFNLDVFERYLFFPDELITFFNLFLLIIQGLRWADVNAATAVGALIIVNDNLSMGAFIDI